jgi:hypothetical protein
MSVTPLLQHYQNYMSKGRKGNQQERKFTAVAKRVLRTSAYIQRTLKQHLHRDSYITALNPCLEKRCVIYYARRSLHCTCLECSIIISSLLLIYLGATTELITRAIEHVKKRRTSAWYRLNFEILSAGKHYSAWWRSYSARSINLYNYRRESCI